MYQLQKGSPRCMVAASEKKYLTLVKIGSEPSSRKNSAKLSEK